jgi:hypothetical protein
MILKVLFSLFFIAQLLISADITNQLKYLGTPYKAQFKSGEDIYSRNVWDMQVYDERIFIGAGNSANEGPSQNSGPVDLIAYIPKENKFVVEGRIDDDQVDIFKILDDTLVIPGHDAKQSWSWGNFYLRNVGTKWEKYRNIPNALHVYDLFYADKKLFAGIGLYEGAAVGITKDLGKTWDIQKLGRSRVYSFLHIGNELFALKKFKRTPKPYFSVAQYVNGNFVPRYDISIYDMFPDTKFEIKYSRATRIISLGNKAVYVGAYKYNSHQTKPFGLYSTQLVENNLKAKKIDLDGFIPNDMIKRGDKIYILASKKTFLNTVNKVFIMDINDFKPKELFSFTNNTFARSFELFDGKFYFGLGCDVDEGNNWKMSDLKKETGDILVYKWK